MNYPVSKRYKKTYKAYFNNFLSNTTDTVEAYNRSTRLLKNSKNGKEANQDTWLQKKHINQ